MFSARSTSDQSSTTSTECHKKTTRSPNTCTAALIFCRPAGSRLSTLSKSKEMEEARELFFLPQVMPRCLRQMTQSPPVCLLRDGDFQATQILREHGQKSGSSSHSITQASNPASGLSDVIIILERPRIVDALSLQPEKNAEADLRCEGILARFLQVKRPHVIIHCTNSVYKSSWMSRFNFGGNLTEYGANKSKLLRGTPLP